MQKKAVILANGAFPTHEIPLKELKESKYIVCCDGAINNLEEAKIEPYAIVGDLDSLDPDLKWKYRDIIHHFSNQDNNDLTKAVHWCLDHGFNEAVIIGATGKRDDHMIGNVFLLPMYVKKIRVKMLTSYGVFTPITRSKNFESFTRQQVSLFSPNPETLITTANLRYALTNEKIEMMWQGTLNESMGESFRIDFEGGPLIVFQEYE
ncbi:thiamine diphosphokinase [Marinifilum sp. N1E240]|uniref:thiamine diphosphokinase n=1 Tax=Marinifilum sp. N1E240 TaxID=2608082 RepID=UPI00128BF762|nr:thiamine diphosphokinase [Marinifilum sp. N1E240]MPQ45977.1 thiamine diphosphokinase [Marinifilum sp. N1E240]